MILSICLSNIDSAAARIKLRPVFYPGEVPKNCRKRNGKNEKKETRGKSTVCRLIEAGLRAGGIKVFCKTTGTDPITIDVAGHEELIRRRGRANIKEQVAILERAAAQGAQVLVVECMAVQPELQHAAQHQILQADIGVITNIRRDHTDVMGETLPQICDALSNTIPRHGVLFTAEVGQFVRLLDKAASLGSGAIQVQPDGTEPEFDFPENIALALAVCQYLGADRETALQGMAHYQRDPYPAKSNLSGLGTAVPAVRNIHRMYPKHHSCQANGGPL